MHYLERHASECGKPQSMSKCWLHVFTKQYDLVLRKVLELQFWRMTWLPKYYRIFFLSKSPIFFKKIIQTDKWYPIYFLFTDEIWPDQNKFKHKYFSIYQNTNCCCKTTVIKLQVLQFRSVYDKKKSTNEGFQNKKTIYIISSQFKATKI